MINILENSPILYNGNLTTPSQHFLNDETFDSNFYFTSTGNTLYYAILRQDLSETIVISTGILHGHYNALNYDYRLDLDEYITIDNQKTPILNQVDYGEYNGTPRYSGLTYYFFGNNSCKLYLAISTTEIIQTNLAANNLSQKTTGDIYIPTGKTITNLVATDKLYFQFWDRTTNDTSFDYSNDNTVKPGGVYNLTVYNYPFNHYFDMVLRVYNPITFGGWYAFRPTMYVNDYGGGTYDIKPYDYCTYIINLVPETTGVELIPDAYITGVTQPTFINELECGERYFFRSDSGVFDYINCTGTRSEVDTITRDEIKIKNRIVQTDIKIKKQIKQNTGFNLTDEQIRGIIKSPIVYTIDNGILKEYVIDNSSFNGFNGKKLSGKNIELTFTDPKQYVQKTNYNLNFFD